MAVKTIGTGGDYSTVQAWEDALLAVLLEAETGQVKNEELSSASTIVTFSAHDTTLGAVTLEAVAGASFKDNANVRTNALRYNASNGAALKCTGTYAPTIDVTGAVPVLIIRNLQIANTGGGGATCSCIDTSTGQAASTWIFKDLILEKTGGSPPPLRIDGSSGAKTPTIINCLMIYRGTSGNGVFTRECNSTYIGCTIVRPSNITAASSGIVKQYGSPIVQNTVIAGFSADVASSFGATSDYNATTFSDVASGLPDPATDHNVYSIAYDTALFVQPSDASGLHDFRTLTGSALVNAGIYDGTNAPNDISGTVRADPPEIGAWELSSASAVQDDYAMDQSPFLEGVQHNVPY